MDVTYEIGAAEPVSTAVIRAVCAVEGRDPGDLRPLDDVLDPGALDVLFAARADGAARTGGRLSFIYSRCAVTIDNGEYLTLKYLATEPPDRNGSDAGRSRVP